MKDACIGKYGHRLDKCKLQHMAVTDLIYLSDKYKVTYATVLFLAHECSLSGPKTGSAIVGHESDHQCLLLIKAVVAHERHIHS